MKQIICTVGMIMCVLDLMAAPRKIPEITCSDTQYSEQKWLASCNNGTEDLDIVGTSVCSDTHGTQQFESAEKLSTSEDEEDNINCWCRIVTPFKSNYVFHSTSLYSTECSNWCAQFCARDITRMKAFRTALFTDIHL